jgi:surface protein
MGYMFYGTPFNKNLGGWNVEKVTNMEYMFYSSSFNQDIGKWKVDNVTNMSYMFANNTTFDQLIRGWNVDNMVNLDSMFAGATAMLYHYLGTMYFGATPSYLYFNFIHDPFYKPSKDCSLPGNSLGDGESTRCPVKPTYKQLDTGGNDPKFNPAYAYALYVRGSLGRPGYQQFVIGSRQLNSVGSYEGAPGNGVRAPPRNKFN